MIRAIPLWKSDALFRFRRPYPATLARRAPASPPCSGPTNTGKTHLAIERMARAFVGNDRPAAAAARPRGLQQGRSSGSAPEDVALITGEEKIKPRNARYWVSTVEAMPRDLDCRLRRHRRDPARSDLDRGHVFTDRILNRRGREETLVLGAATIAADGRAAVARRQCRDASAAVAASFSRATGRSPACRGARAIVAFSAEEVYAIAELIRRQRGGAAVVLGALSPRTRNAQVAIYPVRRRRLPRSPPTPSAWASISTSITSPSHPTANSTAISFAGSTRPNSPRSPAAPAAPRATAPSAPPGAARRSSRNWSMRSKATRFDRVKVLQWRNTDLDFPRSVRCRRRWR